jgi:hypothetical protein
VEALFGKKEVQQGIMQPIAQSQSGDGPMAAVPQTQPPITPASKKVEERFRQLEATWTAETGFLSSYQDIVEHPAFQEIIRLGKDVIPFMLRDLEERPRLWVWALPEITGTNPVPPEDAGHIAKMSEAWLRWGRANGYQW